MPSPPNSPANPGAHAPRAAESSRLSTAYEQRHAVVYDSWLDPAHCFIHQERERCALGLLTREGFTSLADARILEIGCGTGNWLRDVVHWGAAPENVFGVDLLADRVATARRLTAPAVTVTQGDITALDFPDASFDLVIQSTVFSSIIDPERRRRTAAEMRRVLKRTGIIVWYDFHVNNPSNQDVRAVRRSEIAPLFPGCRVHMQRLTLAPPIARALAPISTFACELLALVPWLRTHTLAAIRPE